MTNVVPLPFAPSEQERAAWKVLVGDAAIPGSRVEMLAVASAALGGAVSEAGPNMHALNDILKAADVLGLLATEAEARSSEGVVKKPVYGGVQFHPTRALEIKPRQ